MAVAAVAPEVVDVFQEEWVHDGNPALDVVVSRPTGPWMTVR